MDDETRKRMILLAFMLLLGVRAACCEGKIIRYAEHEGFRVYKQEGRFGIMTADADLVIDARYDAVAPFRKGYAIVVRNGLFGCVQLASGVETVPCVYTSLRWAEESEESQLLFCQRNRAFGLMDANNRMLIEPMYNAVAGFIGGTAIIELDHKQGLIDSSGGTLIPPVWDFMDYASCGHSLALDFESMMYRYIRVQGERNLTGSFDIAHAFSENRAIVIQDGKYGVIDEEGNWIVQCQCDDMLDQYHAGLLGAKKDDQWGYLDLEGQWVIPPQWDTVSDFAPNGLAAVCQDGAWGYIQRDGVVAIQTMYASVHDFMGSYAVVNQNNRYGLVDSKGEIVIPCIWNDISYRSDEPIAVKNDDGFYGFVDMENHVVIDFDYVQASGFQNGLAEVQTIQGDPGSCQWINRQGELVFSGEYWALYIERTEGLAMGDN